MSLSFHLDVKEFDFAQLDQLGALDKIHLLESLGAEGVSQTQNRIAHEKTSPDGEAWAKLNPAYAASKKSGGILESEGHLLTSISSELTGEAQVSWGSNLVYAAIHQTGGRIEAKAGETLVFMLGGQAVFAGAVNIPARPYLGLSEQNKSDMEGVALQFIRNNL